MALILSKQMYSVPWICDRFESSLVFTTEEQIRLNRDGAPLFTLLVATGCDKSQFRGLIEMGVNTYAATAIIYIFVFGFFHYYDQLFL